jgi:hypothetical protein
MDNTVSKGANTSTLCTQSTSEKTTIAGDEFEEVRITISDTDYGAR